MCGDHWNVREQLPYEASYWVPRQNDKVTKEKNQVAVRLLNIGTQSQITVEQYFHETKGEKRETQGQYIKINVSFPYISSRLRKRN